MDARELYQEIVIDHSRNPRNCHEVDNPSHSAEGHNPLCGDRITCSLRCEGDIIEDISFQTAGCAISRSAASLLSETVKGKPRSEVEEIFTKFRAMMADDSGTAPDEAALGKLVAFASVTEYPTRIKCATLALHTMQAALEGKSDAVSTE